MGVLFVVTRKAAVHRSRIVVRLRAFAHHAAASLGECGAFSARPRNTKEYIEKPDRELGGPNRDGGSDGRQITL